RRLTGRPCPRLRKRCGASGPVFRGPGSTGGKPLASLGTLLSMAPALDRCQAKSQGSKRIGCAAVTWVGNSSGRRRLTQRWQIRTGSHSKEVPMSSVRPAPVPSLTREQQIASLMKQLRPKVEETLRRLVERAVDVPAAEEFGAIEYEFREAGLNLANEVRQAAVASRKKRGTSGAA